jgi:NAD(P)-dependent dehydrogenase (short-subunit alcohol dehydrogenase family)
LISIKPTRRRGTPGRKSRSDHWRRDRHRPGHGARHGRRGREGRGRAEINAAAGEQTAQIVTQAGGCCIAVTTDVSQEDSVRAAIETAVRHYGGLHILHSNAGGSTPADNTVVEAPIQEFWRAVRLDLFGTFLGCRFGIPAIIASGGGAVINMASNVALMGVAGLDCYTAAKGGIAAITRSMAVEFAPKKVRVNAIAPAATMTDRVRGRLEAGNPRVTKIAEAHLLGLIQPEDIANMAVFLASDEAPMITGHIYPVDSGITVSRPITPLRRAACCSRRATV